MEGDTDRDILKDAYIKERKFAVVLFLWEKELKYTSIWQKGITTSSFYIDELKAKMFVGIFEVCSQNSEEDLKSLHIIKMLGLSWQSSG